MSDFLQRLAARGGGFAAVSEPRPTYLGARALSTLALLHRAYTPPTDSKGDGEFVTSPEERPEGRGADQSLPSVGLFITERPEQQQEGFEGRDKAPDKNPIPTARVLEREIVSPPEAPGPPGRVDLQKGEARANSAEQPETDDQVIQPRLEAASQSNGGDRLAFQKRSAPIEPSSPVTTPRDKAGVTTDPPQAVVQSDLVQQDGNSSAEQVHSTDHIRRGRPPESGGTTGRQSQIVEPQIDSSEHRGRLPPKSGATEPPSRAPSSKTTTSPDLLLEGFEVSQLVNRVAAEAANAEDHRHLSLTGLPTVRTTREILAQAESPESTQVEPRPKAVMMGADQIPAKPERALEVRIGTIELHAAAEEPPQESRSTSESSRRGRQPSETNAGFDSFDSIRRYCFWRSG